MMFSLFLMPLISFASLPLRRFSAAIFLSRFFDTLTLRCLRHYADAMIFAFDDAISFL